MIYKFEKYIEEHQLCSSKDTILIALSGGADSIVLLDLFYKAGYKLALAHCNFNLRGNESDEDELFVKNIAKQYKIKLHLINFSTEEYANTNKLSIEMAARELRYNWFEQLLIDNKYSKIATGHHLNDSIETLFLNLSRGAGYAGMKGIPTKNGNIIRPLLFATKDDIEIYANENKLKYRTDSSNKSTKYLRNIVRQNIIPAFKLLNPGFEQVMFNNFNNINEASTVLDTYFNDYRENAYSYANKRIQIPFHEIMGKRPEKIHLFQLIQQYGFNRDSVEKIIVAIQKTPGKIFESVSHRLLINRDALIISEISDSLHETCVIKNMNDFNHLPISLTASIIPSKAFKVIKSANYACVDAAKLTFPLTLRKWQQGDYFNPLGMNKRKKISDFLIDSKINRLDKEEIWVLESKGEIAWLVNMRIDNRFKITEETKDVLLIEYKG